MSASSESKPSVHLRGRLFRKYAVYLTGLLSVALLISGLVGVYFSYRDTRVLVDELEREKARNAAIRIGQFIRSAESQLRGALPFGRESNAPADEPQYLELLKLLHLAPAVADAAWIDASGHERVRVSRVTRDVVGSNVDRTAELGFRAASSSKAWYGPVYFRRGTEPFLAAAVAGSQPESGVVIADINLKFVLDVVSAIRSGKAGHAYVVDSRGRLISHPDMSLVLKISDLSALPQVKAALASTGRGNAPGETVIAKDGRGYWSLTAHAPIEDLDWTILVEQPLAEAFAPMLGSVTRSALVLLLGIILAIAASLMLARQMVAPIRTLEAGVERLAAGRLDEPVVVKTRDELEALAGQFNRMARQLQDSYTGLEQKIDARTRELAEANNAKSRFLAAASHDLRQPVHALGLFVAQLNEARDPLARQRIVERIAASSVAVSDLLEALLDISRLDAGNMERQHAEFALQPILERLEHSFALAAQAKGLRLRVRPTRTCIASDPLLLERILLNLVSNAVRYTRTGGVLIGVRRHGGCAAIEVWDTGVGIAPEEQRRIFEEFYRLPSGGADSAKGLGLGLAIVERLARLLDLPISVSSAVGRGSKFSLSAPLAHGPAAEAPVAAPTAQPIRLEGMRVLLIDDAPQAREAAEGLLAQWGCQVAAASSGREALTLFDNNEPRPALIICDYHLGEIERGTDVIRDIRARWGMDVPAVIVSGDVTPILQESAAANGLHLLYKPLKAARLRALLHHVFSNTGAESIIATAPPQSTQDHHAGMEAR
jgi:signal transduction histidine kinase/ActR/RegA family two-component response regulator